MKILTFCWPGLVALMAMAVAGSAQAGSITIADWTFETSQPAAQDLFARSWCRFRVGLSRRCVHL